MKIVVLKEKNTACTEVGFPPFYTKADSTMLKGGKPFFVPDFTNKCMVTFHLVARISRLGKGFSERFASRYFDAWTLAANFTAADRLTDFQQEQAVAVDFDGSTMLGEMVDKDSILIEQQPVQLEVGVWQKGDVSLSGQQTLMLQQIASLSNFFTWRQGDLLFSKSLCEPVEIKINDSVRGFLGKNKLLEFNVK